MLYNLLFEWIFLKLNYDFFFNLNYKLLLLFTICQVLKELCDGPLLSYMASIV